jgi:hypothetical protein
MLSDEGYLGKNIKICNRLLYTFTTIEFTTKIEKNKISKNFYDDVYVASARWVDAYNCVWDIYRIK